MNETADQVRTIRKFNRFYTQKVGVLDEGHLETPFSLAEARILYELAHWNDATASGLGRSLNLDAGYLSRILRRFETQGLVERRPSESDGRQSILGLTEQGREAFAPLDSRAQLEVEKLIQPLSSGQRRQLIDALRTVQRLLGGAQETSAGTLLRPHQPGDMGWVVHRHGVLYAQEYGWGERFEALVAQIVAEFIQNFDRDRERCWIAEREGEIVGSVFLVKKSQEVAKLRLLLVEPSARGLGIGKRLVQECVRFAKFSGYKQITLWTQSILAPARHIYQDAGFRLTHSEPQNSFGHDLIGETWDLDLSLSH